MPTAQTARSAQIRVECSLPLASALTRARSTRPTQVPTYLSSRKIWARSSQTRSRCPTAESQIKTPVSASRKMTQPCAPGTRQIAARSTSSTIAATAANRNVEPVTAQKNAAPQMCVDATRRATKNSAHDWGLIAVLCPTGTTADKLEKVSTADPARGIRTAARIRQTCADARAISEAPATRTEQSTRTHSARSAIPPRAPHRGRREAGPATTATPAPKMIRAAAEPVRGRPNPAPIPTHASTRSATLRTANASMST